MSKANEAACVKILKEKEMQTIVYYPAKHNFTQKKDTTVINLPNKQANNSYNNPQRNREYCFSIKESFGQSKRLDNHWW